MTSVDVVIPCYKYGHFLGLCLESVLSQRGVALRVLIIDDASPDGSAEVARKLAAQDGRVEFRQHAANQGAIATYNEGLDWAAGDYTLIISADDLLTPGALLRAVKHLDAHPEVGLAYGRQIVFETDPPPLSSGSDSDRCGWRVLTGPEFWERGCKTGANPVMTPTAIVRTRLQKQLGWYRQELPLTHDMEMWLRFAAHASVGVLDADQAFKRRHAKSLQTEVCESVLDGLRQHKNAFKVLFRDHGGRIAERGRLQALADRSIAVAAFWLASEAFDRGDAAGFQQCLDFALATYPDLPSLPEWSRLRWKRRLGIKVWSRLRPLIDRVRGQAAPASAGGG
jgi:glycosyltransferase involved in cell wall biosynthesis